MSQPGITSSCRSRTRMKAPVPSDFPRTQSGSSPVLRRRIRSPARYIRNSCAPAAGGNLTSASLPPKTSFSNGSSAAGTSPSSPRISLMIAAPSSGWPRRRMKISKLDRLRSERPAASTRVKSCKPTASLPVSSRFSRNSVARPCIGIGLFTARRNRRVSQA